MVFHFMFRELIGTDPATLKRALSRVFAGDCKKGSISEKWDGKSGQRIVAVLECKLWRSPWRAPERREMEGRQVSLPAHCQRKRLEARSRFLSDG